MLLKKLTLLALICVLLACINMYSQIADAPDAMVAGIQVN